jgi:hypothetical protein
MDFYCVYIQEAHPDDGWQVASNLDQKVMFDQPETLEERESLAQVCVLRLNIEMPMLLDDMDNSIDGLYAALPERLYVLDADGVVRYRTVVGSPGFDVNAWEQAIKLQASVAAT